MIRHEANVPYHAAGDKAHAENIVISDFRYGKVMYLRNAHYMGQELALYGEYSEGEVELWRQLIEPTWNVLDIGAHLGTHTLALSSLVPTGKVLAIEPLQFMYHLLCGNLALNGITNVNALNIAIGEDEKADARVYLPAVDYTKWTNFGMMQMLLGQTGASVPLLRLDDLCRDVQFIKIDVEGMELAVLRGAKRLIRDSRPIVYAEANKESEQAALAAYMRDLGYLAWTHRPPHYNPKNWWHDQMNIAPRIVSMNLLFMPVERSLPDVANQALVRIG